MASLGQIAYEAYVADSGGVSLVSGAPLPDWASQSPQIQHAWDAAAVAVIMVAKPPAFRLPAGPRRRTSERERATKRP
jgi:hypothetical protein